MSKRPLSQEGFGQFWWTTGTNAGDKYVGQFSDDQRHGVGAYHFRNGDVFIGQWVQGRQEGAGEVRYANGNLLIGSWLAGQRSGRFTFTFPNGERYEAYYEGGERTANWRETDAAPPNLALLFGGITDQ